MHEVFCVGGSGYDSEWIFNPGHVTQVFKWNADNDFGEVGPF